MSPSVKHLTKVTPYISSGSILVFAAQFLYHTLNSSRMSTGFWWLTLVFIISLLVFVGLRDEFILMRNTKVHLDDYRLQDFILTTVMIVLSAMATYVISARFGYTTIFSASLVAVLLAFAFPDLESAAYSGVIAGMIGSYLCPHWSIALATALVTAVLYMLFKPYFIGVGGRGGTIPYVATSLVVNLMFDLKTGQGQPMEEYLILPSFIIMTMGAFLTFYLHDKGSLSVVKSSMLVSLVLCILIPDHLYTLTTAMFTGTVIGTSTNQRVESYRHLFVITLICFVLFIPSFHILDGIGGKLGILSLLSYYASMGLKSVALSWKQNRVEIH